MLVPQLSFQVEAAGVPILPFQLNQSTLEYMLLKLVKINFKKSLFSMTAAIGIRTRQLLLSSQYQIHPHSALQLPIRRCPLAWRNLAQHSYNYRKPTVRIQSFSSSNSSGDDSSTFKIPAHMFTFSLALLPCLIYGVYLYRFGPSEEEIEEQIRARYNTTRIQQKNESMKEFFQNAEAGLEDDRLQQVLRGGATVKSGKKRLHAIDPELYGTELGVETKQRVEEELKLAADEKKRKREERREQRRLKKQGSIPNENQDDGSSNASSNAGMTTTLTKAEESMQRHHIPQQTIAFAIIGTIAVAVGYLAGSRRN
jgi:hypothetical protein